VDYQLELYNNIYFIGEEDDDPTGYGNDEDALVVLPKNSEDRGEEGS